MIRNLFVAISVVILSAVTATATVLTFDGISNLSDETIPDDYGDRVTATTDSNGFMYGVGDGFTPNVGMEYASGAPVLPFSLWTSGYGDLTNALGHDEFQVSGEVILRPDPGFKVVLNSFDVAAWSFDREGTVRVLDEDDNVLFDSGTITLPGPGNGSTTFLAGNSIVSESALRIDISLYGDLGLDNVNFSQVRVPEPSCFGLACCVLVAFGYRHRITWRSKTLP